MRVLSVLGTRPEAINAGNAKLVGTEEEAIVREVERLLQDPEHYQQMSQQSQVHGDGRVSERIVKALLELAQHRD